MRDGAMLLLYILLLAMLAALTAYTRNFQSTVIRLGEQIPAAGNLLTPRHQNMRTIALVVAWPAAIGVGVVFVAWWKAVALVVGAFLILVPVIGSFTPRPMSSHYRDRIRLDVERRLAAKGQDAERLRLLLTELDQLNPQDST